MQIAIHIGANCTDDDRLLKSLLRNVGVMRDLGVRIPGPGKYRALLRETIHGLDGRAPAPETRDILLEAILGEGEAEAKRLVLSNAHFICVAKRIFEHGEFYHLIDEKLPGMRALFPSDELHYFFALRNIATFVPATFARQAELPYNRFLKGVDPETLRWTDVIERMRQTDPRAKITVWCDEDTPFLWPEIIRALLGVSAAQRIAGGFDLLHGLLTDDGMQAMVDHLRQTPPRTEREKRELIGDFLDAYGAPDKMEEEVDLPGWTLDRIMALTALYEEDIAQIAARPDVTFLRP